MSTSTTLETEDQNQEQAETPVLYWVAAYHQDRAYGGPAEGGWYYDTGSLCTSVDTYKQLGMRPECFVNQDESITYLDKMRKAIMCSEGEG